MSAIPSLQAPVPGPAAFSGLAFDDRPTPGTLLMARDTSRLAAHDPMPSMVWFAWDRPTITLGHLQDEGGALDLERCAAEGIPVVRRPTGGRAVFHVDEWTYGAVVPLAHPGLGGSLRDSCRALVAVVARALGEAYGIALDRNAPAWGHGVAPSAACFGRSFGYEATVAGRKLMGSAQRRVGGSLLQQGSLLVGPGHEALAGYLNGGGAAQARTLATSAVTLTELLGRRPDPAPFRAALRRAWRQAVESTARPL